MEDKQFDARAFIESIYYHHGHAIHARSFPDSEKQVIHCQCRQDFRYPGDHFKHAEETRINEAIEKLRAYAAGLAASGAQRLREAFEQKSKLYHRTQAYHSATSAHAGVSFEDCLEVECVTAREVLAAPAVAQACSCRQTVETAARMQPSKEVRGIILAIAENLPAVRPAELSEEQVRDAVEAFNRIGGGSYASLTAKFNALLRSGAGEGQK